MEGVGMVMVLLLAGALVWAFGHAAEQQKQRRLAAAAALGGGVGQDGRLYVPWGSTQVAISFTTTGSKHKSYWTYVEAALPPAYPLALYLRAHVYEDALLIQRGAMVDVVFGDPSFDAAYLVEGAPADVVRNLLTPGARAGLLARPPLKVDVVNGVVQLLGSGWQEDPAVLRPWVEIVGSLAGGVRDAYASADEAIPMASTGGAYRGIPDDQPLQDARMARFAEVQRLGQIRQARGGAGTLIVIGVAALMIVAVLSQSRC